MKRLSILTVFLIVFLSCSLSAWAQPQETFKTKYTTVYFLSQEDINNFIWRLGGRRSDFSEDTAMASSRIDRIIQRVMTILDMWPKDFKIDITLQREILEYKKVAIYNRNTKAIRVSVDYVSDGVVAHEIAHAIIDQSFPVPPPTKVQEILAQYVDKHLWSDY